MEKFYLQFFCKAELANPHRREAGRSLPRYLHTDESLTAVSEQFQTPPTHKKNHQCNVIYFMCTAHSHSTSFGYGGSCYSDKCERTDSHQQCNHSELLNNDYLTGEVRGLHLCPPTSLRCNWSPGRLIDRKLFGMSFDLLLMNRDTRGPLPHHTGYFRWPISMPDF